MKYTCQFSSDLEHGNPLFPDFCFLSMPNESDIEPKWDKRDKKYNGTDAYYKSLSKSKAKAKGLPQVTQSTHSRLIADKGYFKRLMKSCPLFSKGKRVVIWDTESDCVGAGYSLDKSREIHCIELFTDRVLHIRKYLTDVDPRIPNDAFSVETAVRQ